MSIKTQRYYFGRLNIISAYTGSKKDFLVQGLNSDVLLFIRNYNWGFFEVEVIQDEEEEYLSGFLVKYRPLDPSEFVNVETREIQEQEVRDRITAKSCFFLHIRTGVVAYQVTTDINDNLFRENFCKLLQQAYDNLFIDTEIQAINQEETFFEAIKSFNSIRKISIYLHPSNPSSRDIWKSVDERLKRLDLENYTEIYKSKSESRSLNIENDEEINSKLHMANDGYGKAKVTGKKGEDYETITTGDTPITYEVEYEVIDNEPTINLDPTNLLSQIKPTFKSLFRRIRDGNNQG